ncbi:MAG TPA: alginate export family protein [Candidatus Deferrimicrobium sp.]|nr:alginate export family protein [Candidatus Deferrimicrobium sp.]
MNGLYRFAASLALALSVALPAVADVQISLGGQVRLRQQFDHRGFDTAAVWNQFGEMRSRVNVHAVVDGNTHAVVEFQDSRIAGDYTQFGSSASGDVNDGKNVDLHQAYLEIDTLFGTGWGGKAGRFEINQGNERVFGAVGWNNVGRSWEGTQLWFDHERIRLTGFWLKRLELLDSDYNRDFDIFGLYGNIKALKDAKFDLFAFYEHDADTNGYAKGLNKLDRFNIGTYYQRTYQQFDFELNGVFQFGTLPRDTLPDTGEVDISAFMLAFEAGYTFPGTANARIAAGIDYASGDDSLGDDKYKAYDNLYYTGHKFRGYMDYFTASNVEGLMDIMLRGKIEPAPGWKLEADAHYFSTAQDYISPVDTTKTKDVGIEVDFVATTTRVSGVKLEAGAAVFLPQEAWAAFKYSVAKDPDPGYWVWAMATANFGK